MGRVMRISQSIPGMINPAVFELTAIREVIENFVDCFDVELNEGKRLYP